MMKTRLDTKLVQLGLVSGRDKAKAIIMAGIVYVNGQKADKAGTEVLDEDKIELRGETLRYVSRGGLNWKKLLNHSRFRFRMLSVWYWRIYRRIH